MTTMPLRPTPLPALWNPAGEPSTETPLTSRRRRSAATSSMHVVDAGRGVAELRTQQLPFSARASVHMSGSLAWPLAGAVVGALLLGLPGAMIGGVAGWLIAR